MASVTLTITGTATETLPSGVVFEQYLYSIFPPGGGTPFDLKNTTALSATLEIPDTPGDYVASVEAIDQNGQPIGSPFQFHFPLPFPTTYVGPATVGITVS